MLFLTVGLNSCTGTKLQISNPWCVWCMLAYSTIKGHMWGTCTWVKYSLFCFLRALQSWCIEGLMTNTWGSCTTLFPTLALVKTKRLHADLRSVSTRKARKMNNNGNVCASQCFALFERGRPGFIVCMRALAVFFFRDQRSKNSTKHRIVTPQDS